MRSTIVGSAGLITALNRAQVPRGALRQCVNAITRGGWVMPRPPIREYDAGHTPLGFKAVFGSQNSFSAGIAIGGDGKLYFDSGNLTDGSSFASFGSASFVNFQRASIFQANAAAFLGTSDTGFWKLDKYDGTAAAYKAGIQRGLDLTLTLTGATGFLATTATAAYRIVWGFIDANGYVSLGPPGGRYLATAGGTAQNVIAKSAIPSYIAAAADPTLYFYMLFRSKQVVGAPTDDMQLAFQSYLTSTDVSNGFIQITDVTPDSMLGPALYTGPSQETILFENSQPPIATCAAFWKGCAWFGNTKQRHRYDVAMLATPDTYSLNGAGAQVQAATPIAGQATYTFATAGTYDFSGLDTSNVLAVKNCTNAGNNGVFAVVSVNTGARQIVVTNGGAVNEAAPPATAAAICAGLTVAAVRYNAVWTEDIPNKRYGVGVSGTASTDVQTTTASLVRCVNYNAAATVYAHDVSSVDSSPGRIRLEERSIGGASFTVQAFGFKTSAASGASVYANKFAPDLNAARTSDNRTATNRLYRSKQFIPGAVPEAQYEDLGDTGSLLWLCPLRDSLYIFSTTGLYRVTGDGINFSIVLLSPTTLLVGVPCVFEDAVFAVTSRGFVRVTDAGSVDVLDGAIRPNVEAWLGFWFGDAAANQGVNGKAFVVASAQSRLVYFSMAIGVAAGGFGRSVLQPYECLSFNVDNGTWATVNTPWDGLIDGTLGISSRLMYTQGFQSGGRLWWCGTATDASGIWTEEPPNLREAVFVVPRPVSGVAPPGDRRSVNITAVVGSVVTVDVGGSSSRYVPAIGDVLLINAPGTGVHHGGGKIVTAVQANGVSGWDLTLGVYVSPPGIAFVVGRAVVAFGSFSFDTVGMAVRWHPFVAEDAAGVRLFSELAVLMSDDSTADAVTILITTELDQNVGDEGTTTTKQFAIRSGVSGIHQMCSRFSVEVEHNQPMKHLLIEGISFQFEPQPDGTTLG